jgi:vacuolar protein sorting-associated protein 1
MIDMIPKAIMLNLVNKAKDDLQNELLGDLYKSDIISELLRESEVRFLFFPSLESKF